MGIMVSEIYEALIAAGAPEDKAKAAAEAIPVSDLLATREDIADLKSKLDIADTKGPTGHRRHQAGYRRL